MGGNKQTGAMSKTEEGINKKNQLGGADPIKPVYDSSAPDIGGKVLNGLQYVWALLVYYVTVYKYETTYLLCLLAYITAIILLYIFNPKGLISEDNKTGMIFLSIFGAGILIATFIIYLSKKEEFGNETKPTLLSILGKSLTMLFSLGLAIAIIYLLFYLGAYFANFTTFFLFGLNALIIIGLITILVKYFGIHGGEPSHEKPTGFKLFLRMLFNVITYIPCLLLDLVDYIKYQYQITTKPIVIILLVELILIGIYFTYQWVMEQVLTHNSTQLLKRPVNLNIETSLGSFRDVNFVDEKFQYKYAISSWIFIDSFPPETNSNYDEYTSILNIGNKPNILYNVAKNKLRFKMELAGKTEKIIYETTDFNMQRWNNIIINYDGATLDIFINNKLVSSTPGVIPYNDNTMITAGTNRGILGGICNVNYFKENISMGKINWIYNSVKHLNPPVI